MATAEERAAMLIRDAKHTIETCIRTLELTADDYAVESRRTALEAEAYRIAADRVREMFKEKTDD